MRAVMVLTQCFSLRRRSFRAAPGRLSRIFNAKGAVGRSLATGHGRPACPLLTWTPNPHYPRKWACFCTFSPLLRLT